MSEVFQRLKRRKEIKAKMAKLREQDESVLIIHYSCESFSQCQNIHSPRITSIAIRHLASGQTDSFSIGKVAEEKDIDINSIEERYDELEFDMLSSYFDFVNSSKSYIWIHWNMRDIHYGFPAIEHRFKILGGNPVKIDENKKFDLSRAFVDIYGEKYINHPRLESLIDKNKISKIDFMSGEDESIAFINKEYVKLHKSTLRKVDILENIFNRCINNTLKTNASWIDMYGCSIEYILKSIKDHWIVSLTLGIIGLLTAIVRFWDIFVRFFGHGK